MQESNIFNAAVKLPAAERAAYLDRACGADASLRLEVEGLLRAHEQPGEFMHRPPIADMATDYRPGPERPGTRIGPYKLLQYLGEGGMGTVFLAEQSKPVRRMVALKIIKPGMDSSHVLARFEAERQALAIMDHPNIAKVFDAGTTQVGLELPPRPSVAKGEEGAPGGAANTDGAGGKGTNGETIPLGRPYFVMELVKGVPITEFCDKNKLTTRQRLELFVPVCHAIQHAHMKGIIHRDIKPSNVLIALYDGKPVPKVIDFGVAKAMSDPLTERTMFTQIGQIVGTFEYMSPEQATLNQLDIDTRSDIYSLGVLLYELLTGMTPLSKERLRTLALDQMLRTIREEEPVRPSVKLSSEAGALATAAAYRNVASSKLTGMLRGELDWIVMKCLEKERNRRFVTAGSLAEDIERYLRDEPVTACPPSLAYRARKAYRKNRIAITVTGVIGAVLLAATAVSIVFAIAADHARRKAEAAEAEISNKHDIAEKAKKEAESERDKNAATLQKLSKTQEEQRHNQYAWDMQIMATAWDTGRIGQMQQLLDRHAEELRAFEWHYWNKQIHNERRKRKFENANPVAVSGSTFGPGGGRSASTQWAMNELGTRVACVSFELQGEPQTDPNTKAAPGPVPRAYFLDVYDTADGRRLCHHQFFHQPTSNIVPRPTSLVLNRDGTRVVLGWSELGPSASGRGMAPRDSDQVFRVIDVATSGSVYELKQAGDHEGPVIGPLSANYVPFFFAEGKRLALVAVPPPRAVTNERGGTVYTASPTAQVHVIDVQARPAKELCRFETSNSFSGPLPGSNLAISPNGTRIVHIKAISGNEPTTEKTITSTYSLAMLDSATGKELNNWKLTYPRGFVSLSFSPDGRKLALAQTSLPRFDDDPGMSNLRLTLSMLEAETGKELFKEAIDLDNQLSGGPFRWPFFSPDGTRLYLRGNAGNLNNAAKVLAFHADSGKPVAGFDGDFTLGKFVFSADYAHLYAIEANALVIRSALTGKLIRTLRGHVENITYLGLAGDGRVLSSLDNTGEFKVWDTAPVPPIPLRGLLSANPRFNSTTARLSPDGRYVVGVPTDDKDIAGAGQGLDESDVTRLALWDAANGRMQPLALRPLPERPREVEKGQSLTSARAVRYSANSRFVCLIRHRSPAPRFGDGAADVETKGPQSAFSDLTVWDTATGQETAYLQLPIEAATSSNIIELTPDGKTAVVGGRFRREINTPASGLHMAAFDLATGRQLWSRSPDANSGPSAMNSTITISPDGRTILMFERGFTNTDGTLVADTMRCQVLETATGNPLRTLHVGFGPIGFGPIAPAAWSPDGKRIALTSGRFGGPRRSDKLLHVLDVETGQEVMGLAAPPGGNVSLGQVVFSPDGRRIAGQQGDISNFVTGGQLKIWDADTGNEMLSLPVEGVRSPVYAPQFAFTPDGYRIAEFNPPSNRASTAANPVYATVRFIDATPPGEK
jgi:serine/threonine protein kinase/WD40 repeat protein